MKKQLLIIAIFILYSNYFAQTDRLWSENLKRISLPVFENMKTLDNPKLFHLNLDGLKKALKKVSKREATEKSEVIISFPNPSGQMEHFRVTEHSNFAPELAAKYPDIKSYVGVGIKDPLSKIYFSISPLGLSSMELYSDRSAVFIEPYTKDRSTYIIYKKSDRKDNLNKFECQVKDIAQKRSNVITQKNADDATLRIFRLALSCTGEYTAYFGGTKSLALAAMNNTMTRLNGIFENELAIRTILIPNNDNIIYTNAATDPYSPSSQRKNWHYQLMTTLNSTIGNANFDIGHLFSRDGNGGNSGCIGCICSDDMSTTTSQGIIYPNAYKGSGYSSPLDGIPFGDTFDIDIVAHEMGHQLGANHTWSFISQTQLQPVEPGSGSTIMGYAGFPPYSIQKNSDPFFHAISIEQIINNIKNKTCSVNINTGNSIPTANAGPDYTIPKSTPFMLTGSGSDADGDPLTYIWEQIDKGTDDETGSNSAAKANKIAGPIFRSWTPTHSPVRYFPKMSSILAGATTTAGEEIDVEALPSVARTLNFRFTVRDNKAGGAGNKSDNMRITVNPSAGPFMITSQNTAVSYPAGSTQKVTWDVAGTTGNGINTANVDILWSTDNGNTWTTLLAETPNDGSQTITIPKTLTSSGRIMVKGTNHIFFDVNNANISVINPDKNPIDKFETEIKLFPNPIKNILTVTNMSNEKYNIYDMSGRLIMKGNLKNGKVNVNKLTEGAYIIRIGKFSKKFIKK